MTEATEPNTTHGSDLDSAPADDVVDQDVVDHDVHDHDVDDIDVPQTIEQARKLRSENRSLRARLHTAETDLEAATARLTAADRREIERHAATVLVDPADVWTAQPDTSAFYDDEFHDIVGDKVITAAKELAAAKPHLAKPPSAPPPTDRPIEGLRAGARAPEDVPAPTWAGAIRGTGG